ncbi:MAG: hypothetical protein RMJ98_16585 [Myxococcales bacterium]|nr:hypothetical protein [Polyangiaceae bacterium]MDW8250913.1 hypothetical protein [Myxococcales bacterium]
MLAPKVRFEGWDVLDWVRLLSLFESSPSPSVGVLVLHDGQKLRKILHTRVGRLNPGGQSWGRPLEELAREHGANWIAAFHLGALEEAMDRLGARLQRHDDLLDQIWKGLDVLRELAEEGAIATWPLRLRGSPPLSLPVLRRSLDALCPRGASIAIGLFEAGELWSALVLSRGPTGVDRILGPEHLRSSMGLLSGDFRRDYRHLLHAIESIVGPLHFGLFTEVKTLRRLITEGRPGSWSRAVLVRDVILAPSTVAVALPLSFDAARGLSRSFLVAASHFQFDQRFASALSTLRTPERRGTLLQSLRLLLRRLSK